MNNILLQKLSRILKSQKSILRWAVAMLIVGFVWWYFIDLDLSIGNMWHKVAYAEVVLYATFTLLFWIFIAITTYRVTYFRNIQKKSLTLWSMGGVIGTLVAWCPACSITLASYLWMASLFSLLPYKWAELKVLAIVILLYSIYQTMKDLETCPKKREKSFSFLWQWTMNKTTLMAVIIGVVAVGVALIGNAKNWSFNMVSDPDPAITDQIEEASESFVPSSAPSWVCGNSNGECWCGWWKSASEDTWCWGGDCGCGWWWDKKGCWCGW